MGRNVAASCVAPAGGRETVAASVGRTWRELSVDSADALKLNVAHAKATNARPDDPRRCDLPPCSHAVLELADTHQIFPTRGILSAGSRFAGLGAGHATACRY